MIRVCNRRVDEAVYSYGKENGISRETVASKLGMRSVTLSKRLNGERDWKVKELATLSSLTGVPFKDFFEEVEE